MDNEIITIAKFYLNKAASIYGRQFSTPRMSFGIQGTTAGRAWYLTNQIKFNCALFYSNKEIFLKRTVPHELAHLISFALYGNEGTGHGHRWRSVMRALGVDDIGRCHHYDVSKVKRSKGNIGVCSPRINSF